MIASDLYRRMVSIIVPTICATGRHHRHNYLQRLLDDQRGRWNQYAGEQYQDEELNGVENHNRAAD